MSIPVLFEVMEQMILHHDTLLELSEQKVPILVGNKVEELNRIVHKETQLIRQLGECENQRIEAVNHFLISKGFRPTPNITMNEVIKLIFRQEDKETAVRLQGELLSRMQKLKVLNEKNGQLIEQSLAFIEYSLDLVVGPPDDDTIYRNPANRVTGAKRNSYFDTRA
ncbi:MAG: flagellar protein FlgN [Gorillibacterium sp.]|nr:flagellar protein FlgN [Gorillibacterium sp.]